MDSYVPMADAMWREQMRQDCAARTTNVTGCVEDTVGAMQSRTSPRDLSAPRREGDSETSPDVIADWNRPDATLIEFNWTPCTPFLVQRGLDQWRAKHLNIVATGVNPIRLDKPPIPQNPLTQGLRGAKLPGIPGKPGADGADTKDKVYACLRAVTVRSGIRDRWANYAHALLRETVPQDDAIILPSTRPMQSQPEKPIACETGDKPACAMGTLKDGAKTDDGALTSRRFARAGYINDNLLSGAGKPFEPLFRSGYIGEDSAYEGETAVSKVTDIEWRNAWLDRTQWVVLVRDHFLQRLRTQSLEPSYALPDPGKLVYCFGPEVRYGGIPSGKQYYWRNDNPDGNTGCHWRNKEKEKALDPKADYLALDISYDPDATMKLSHGPLFWDYWDRAQQRFVGRAVERLARYKSAAPLVQNDRDPKAPELPAKLGPKPCPNPLPLNGNGKKCNAEAPPRDAVTPRFGDVYNGPEAPAKSGVSQAKGS
jgi:hypothetical protein